MRYFFGHLVLEKMLKALDVKKAGEIPPYTHRLVVLAEKCELRLSKEQKEFWEIVTGVNIAARYPDQKSKFYKKSTKQICRRKFNEIREMYEWLRSLTKLETYSTASPSCGSPECTPTDRNHHRQPPYPCCPPSPEHCRDDPSENIPSSKWSSKSPANTAAHWW